MKTKSTAAAALSHEEIEALAQQLWRQAGCPAGRETHFWQEAEDQILAQSTSGQKASAQEANT